MIRTVIKYTDNKILLNDAEVFETSKTLFPGMYDIELDDYGKFKNFRSLSKPKVFPLMPSTEIVNIEDYISKFLSVKYEQLCSKAKILKKSGLLLYGEAGIGKSNYINYLINKTIDEQNACVFNIDNTGKLSVIIEKIKELRAIQNTLFVIVLEEIDSLFGGNWSPEAMLKNFMDGINSIDNCLFLSSTNYIDIIPKSLMERPSRFKKVLEIKSDPDIDKMKQWLTTTYKGFLDDITKEECEYLHDLCLNKTIDEIKHVLIDYKMGISNPSFVRRKIGFSGAQTPNNSSMEVRDPLEIGRALEKAAYMNITKEQDLGVESESRVKLRETLRTWGNYKIRENCLYLYDNAFLKNENLLSLLKANKIKVQLDLLT